MDRKLRKIPERKWIGGVAAGVGYWLGVPTWVVRLLWACSITFFGAGALLYVLFWIFMPKWEQTPLDYEERAGG